MQYLVRNKEKILFDKIDKELVLSHIWCIHSGYATTNIKVNGKYRTFLLHRMLLSPTKEQQVDHKNGNRLDNRRKNIRLCSAYENRKNKTKILATSGYKGVYKVDRKKPWCARISINGVTKHLGLFKTKKEAALAYDKSAKYYFKDFAFTNF